MSLHIALLLGIPTRPAPARTHDSPPPKMDQETFRFVKDSVKREHFDDHRARVLRTAVDAGARFDCDQARELVACFTFGSGQVEAAVILHPRVTDPIRFEHVLDVFTFESDKDRARRAIRSAR